MNAGEDCDGLLGNQTCESLGYGSGSLVCTNNCTWDESGCQATCQSCTEASEMGACIAENAACDADPTCKAFESCYKGCQTQACIDVCLAILMKQEDFDLYNAQIYCVCEEACVSECAEECS